MGRKVSDGKAFDATPPSGEVINDYDLYRVAGWNGVAVGTKDAGVAKTLAFECDPPAIYSVKTPTGGGAITPAVGAFLYWNDPSAFQRGDTHLKTAPTAEGDSPCFEVTATKNAAGYIQGRVLNGSGGGGAEAVGKADVTPQTSPGHATGVNGTGSNAAPLADFNVLIDKLVASGVLT